MLNGYRCDGTGVGSFLLKDYVGELMFGECHAHIFMNGYDYPKAVRDHTKEPNESLIREHLQAYADRGIRFVRDGGDHLGVSALAKKLAKEYGIDYRTPVFAIHKNGHYGGIVGKGFDTMQEYAQLVRSARTQGADFVKIMTTGIMDFDTDGHITGEALTRQEVREMIHIAHEEGMAVMSHTNGDGPVYDAEEAGVDSVEHGNYMGAAAMEALADSDTVWVPTAVTISNLIGSGRFDDAVIEKIREKARENIAQAFACGVNVGLGSDAGAYRVLHGQGLEDEYAFFMDVVKDRQKVDTVLEYSESIIRKKFKVNRNGDT